MPDPVESPREPQPLRPLDMGQSQPRVQTPMLPVDRPEDTQEALRLIQITVVQGDKDCA